MILIRQDGSSWNFSFKATLKQEISYREVWRDFLREGRSGPRQRQKTDVVWVTPTSIRWTYKKEWKGWLGWTRGGKRLISKREMSEVNRTKAQGALLRQQDGHDGALNKVATRGDKWREGQRKQTNKGGGCKMWWSCGKCIHFSPLHHQGTCTAS